MTIRNEFWQHRHEVPLSDGGALTVCRTTGEILGGELHIDKWGRPSEEGTRSGYRIQPTEREAALAQEVWRLAQEAKKAPPRPWHYVTEKLPEPGQRVRFWVVTHPAAAPDSRRTGWYHGPHEGRVDRAAWYDGLFHYAEGPREGQVYAWEPEPEPPPLPEGGR